MRIVQSPPPDRNIHRSEFSKTKVIQPTIGLFIPFAGCITICLVKSWSHYRKYICTPDSEAEKYPASGKPETGFAAGRSPLVDPEGIEPLTSALRSPLRFNCDFVWFDAIGFVVRFVAVSDSTYLGRFEVIFDPFLGLVSTKSQQNPRENV